MAEPETSVVSLGTKEAATPDVPVGDAYRDVTYPVVWDGGGWVGEDEVPWRGVGCCR